MKDSIAHQKKRVTEMMMSLLKELGEIGSVIGGNAAEFKVGLPVKTPLFAISDL